MRMILILTTLLVIVSNSIEGQFRSINNVTVSENGEKIAWIDGYEISYLDTINFIDIKTKNAGGDKIELSGDGKILYFIRNQELYYGEFDYINRIVNIEKLPGEKYSRLYLDVNYKGNIAIATIETDSAVNEYKKCWPGNRNLVFIEKTKENFQMSIPQEKIGDCEYFDDIYLMDDSSIICNHEDKIVEINRRKDNWYSTTIANSDYDLNYGGVCKQKKLFISSRRKDIFIDTSEHISTLYFHQKKNGLWQPPIEILPFHKEMISWDRHISPDGTKIVFCYYIRAFDNNDIVRTDYIIMRYEKGKWCKPELLFTAPSDKGKWVQIWSSALSNNNFVFSTTRDEVYIFTSLDKSGVLIRVK